MTPSANSSESKNRTENRMITFNLFILVSSPFAEFKIIVLNFHVLFDRGRKGTRTNQTPVHTSPDSINRQIRTLSLK